MYIALASASKDIRVQAALPAIASALEKQLYQHYAPFWQADGMNVRVTDLSHPSLRDSSVAPLIVYDDPDEPNALGYHSITEGRVYGKAFWSVIQKSGGSLSTGANSLSCTLSHEALEMVGNPYVNFWCDIDDSTQEGIEMSDRVEGDSYVIDGVAVSDFLGPRAFREGPGPYDWMNLLKSPFELRPGGYAIRRKTGQGKVFNVWGVNYPEEKRLLKTGPDSRFAKRQAVLSSIPISQESSDQ